MKRFFIIVIVTLFFAGFSGCSEYDDSNLWDSVNSLEEKVTTLETKVNQLNTEIDAIKVLVDALNAGRVITGVTDTPTGYLITFSNNTSISINHGANGADAPVIGVKEDNGVYYWTLTIDSETSWLLDSQDKKLLVSGTTPIMGVDSEGYWTVNGERITGADAQPIKAKGENGDSFFRSVTNDETTVTFTLADGTEIIIPKAESLAIRISVTSTEYFPYGATKDYDIALPGSVSIVITKPDGWKASVTNGKLSVTAPQHANEYAEREGDISITVIGQNATSNKTFAVIAGYNYVIDFEDPRVADYLAGPTSYGENLYDDFTGDNRYWGYDDADSELYMMLNTSISWTTYEESTEFSHGGIAISQWNDITTEGYTNQCSVYYNDVTTSKGGYKGSATFAVAYIGFSGVPTAISFLNDELGTDNECIFDHFYVTNNTYAVLSMRNGDGFAKSFSYEDEDWFKLIIKGIDKNGNSTGTVEFYLADFRTPSSPGIVTTWTKVDLSSLGKVAEIQFNMQSTDNSYGMINTPAYFCFDNLAIWK
jgi:hypothetical protein